MTFQRKNVTRQILAIALFTFGSIGLSVAAIVSPIGTPNTQAAIFQHPSSTTPSANQIAWWDITGIYLNVNGQPFYFGEYSQRGDAGIVYSGSTWELKSNGQVIGHGYGGVSGRFYNWACQKFGGC
jgi:hypothetical protein